MIDCSPRGRDDDGSVDGREEYDGSRNADGMHREAIRNRRQPNDCEEIPAGVDE
jgi:hypothetical protein